MKRALILAVSLTLLIGPAVSVVGHNDSNSDMSITGTGSSAGSTVAAGPNGTEYRSTVGMQGRTQNFTGNEVRNASISPSEISFQGTIVADTPCQVINHEVEEDEELYKLEIFTKNPEDFSGVCAQVRTGINYQASFQGEEGVRLEVSHNEEKLETFQTVSDKGNKNKEQRSLLQKLMSLLGL